MVDEAPAELRIEFDSTRVLARISRERAETNSPVWERLRAYFASANDVRFSSLSIDMPWPKVLEIIREFGARSVQEALNFRFRPTGEASHRIKTYLQELKEARTKRHHLTLQVDAAEIQTRLASKGFTKRSLKDFQLRDIAHLLSLSHGANFSVPGAGKTTVAFALHLLAATGNEPLLVISPKAAFPAWRTIVEECMAADAPDNGAEPFVVLDGREQEIDRILRSGARRLVMSYDVMVRQQSALTAFFLRQPVHLILDESHRMKAGIASQRGAYLLSIASLPVRRDILSGTPMPQDANDLASQLEFLWPASGYELQLQRGAAPRDVLGSLYVRTTKQELGLPEAKRHYYQIDMAQGQLALYSVVRSETLRQLTQTTKSRSQPDYIKARKSVMRLLQLSVNPTLALQSMMTEDRSVNSGIVDRVVEEGPSSKMRAVAAHARKLAHEGRKSVIWTIFTGNILDLETLLADLNPVSLYGAVPSGEFNDPLTREGRLHRFHVDNSCKVMIANPAAAGEGISLHTVCHEALYLDRSYVSTHYLQSIDRIHRLGLPAGTETNIHIYRSKAPREIGSIDLSVSRRLAFKIRNLQKLLNDPDLDVIAFDEENADDPVDLNFDIQDLVDLVDELEGRQAIDVEEG